jgi:15-cis-phytoene synthase
MTSTDDPERTLALSYARDADRPALAALFALDDALGALLRTTSEPAIAQIRLAWWREEIARLAQSTAPAMPVLAGLSEHVLPRGIDPVRLVEIVEGWEVLIEAQVLDREALMNFAASRGGALFAIGGDLLNVALDPAAGEGWACSDLARHLANEDEAAIAHQLAQERLSVKRRWPRAARSLGAIAAIAAMDLALPPGVAPPIGSPKRVARLAWMRLTGR